MITDNPQPGADLQPIDNHPAEQKPSEKKPPAIPEEDDPAIKETEEQPS